MAALLTGKLGVQVGWFASKAQEAEAHADQLRRLAFALWVGEHNEYVGALQGLLIERVAAGFKFGGPGHERAEAVRWVVQAQALLAMRVLAVRVASVHLTALWPIAMAALQRILLAPEAARRRSSRASSSAPSSRSSPTLLALWLDVRPAGGAAPAAVPPRRSHPSTGHRGAATIARRRRRRR